MSPEIRPITSDEVLPYRRQLTETFGADLTTSQAADEDRFRALMPLDRTLAAFDDGEIVGTIADKAFDLTLPGGAAVPLAGTTMVSVRPTHTRRGLARALMTRHLETARDRGDVVAALWTSESGIYGRFGYGSASDRAVVDVPAGVEFIAEGSDGRVHHLGSDEAATVLPPVYTAVAGERPGMLSRNDVQWQWWMHDPEDERRGKSALRYAVYEGSDGVEGYVVFRLEEDWQEFVSAGKVHVRELVAATPAAHEALWRHLTSIDLFTTVNYWNARVDDELRWRLRSPREAQMSIGDALWVRFLDVERALGARSYAAPGTLAIRIEDPVFEELSGVYELLVGADVSCTKRDTAEPDLTMDSATLAALALGGRDPIVLAQAGLIAGTADAVRAAQAMFRWPLAPWCPEVF